MRNFLRDIKVGTKIFVLVGLTVLLMSSIIGLGLRQITMIGGEVKAIAEEDVILLEALNKIVFHNSEQAFHFERAIRFGKRMAQDEAAKGEFETERKNFLKYGQMIAQKIKENRAFVERMYEKYKTTHRREKRVLQVDYELRNIDKEHADYQFLAERVFNLLFQGKLKEAEPAIQKITRESKEEEEKHFRGMNKPMESLVLAIEGFVEDSIVRAEESKRTAVIGMLLISVCVLLFSLSLGIFVSRSISKPLRIAVNAAQQISAGDRDVKIEAIAKDETGQLLKAMEKMSCSINEKEEALRQANMNLRVEIAERKKAQKELRESMEQLERFNRLAMGREGRVIELKREVNDLLAELGREPEYKNIEEIAEISVHKSDSKK